MAKRKNRLKPINHEIRQLEMLKTQTPNETPFDLRPISDTLIDIAITCLQGVYILEEKHSKENVDFGSIHNDAQKLASMLATDLEWSEVGKHKIAVLIMPA